MQGFVPGFGPGFIQKAKILCAEVFFFKKSINFIFKFKKLFIASPRVFVKPHVAAFPFVGSWCIEMFEISWIRLGSAPLGLWRIVGLELEEVQLWKSAVDSVSWFVSKLVWDLLLLFGTFGESPADRELELHCIVWFFIVEDTLFRLYFSWRFFLKIFFQDSIILKIDGFMVIKIKI